MATTNKSSPWVWISLAVIIGLFVTFILFLDQKIVKNGRQQSEIPQRQNITTQPVIDFYSILPDRKMDVPETLQSDENTTNKSNNISRAGVRFILQAGSFKKPEDADRRKAELALLGLEAAIKRADVQGVSYHRVELGPFSDDGFYSQVKNRLISNDIEYIAKTAR